MIIRVLRKHYQKYQCLPHIMAAAKHLA